MGETEPHERIEAYLEGRMSAEEQAETEKLLREDAAFAALLQKHRAARTLLEIGAVDRLVREAFEQDQEEEAEVVPLFRRLLPLAAAVACLLVLSLPLFYANSQYSSLALARAQYIHPDAGGLRGATASDDTQALLAAGKYAEAIPLLQAVPPADPGYAEARMNLGHAFFQTRRFSDAAKAFTQVARLEDVRFSAAAQWNTALSLLAAGQAQAAQTALQEIAAQENHAYRDKSQVLIQQLGSAWRRLPGVK